MVPPGGRNRVKNPKKTQANQLVPVWLPYSARRDYARFRALREKGKIETRGRPLEYDEEEIIGLFIDLEARRQLLRMSLSGYLRDIKLRIVTGTTRQPPAAAERGRLRRYHSDGQRHVEHWRRTLFMGRPHPRAANYDAQLACKKAELAKKPRSQLFILNIM
jgi:hypothetical protein